MLRSVHVLLLALLCAWLAQHAQHALHIRNNSGDVPLWQAGQSGLLLCRLLGVLRYSFLELLLAMLCAWHAQHAQHALHIRNNSGDVPLWQAGQSWLLLCRLLGVLRYSFLELLLAMLCAWHAQHAQHALHIRNNSGDVPLWQAGQSWLLLCRLLDVLRRSVHVLLLALLCSRLAQHAQHPLHISKHTSMLCGASACCMRTGQDGS